MASLCLARFKEPSVPPRFRSSFDADDLEKELEETYPYDLFPEYYDPPFGKRAYPIIREFNPTAGYAVREWVKGATWPELVQRTTNEKYAQGDLMALLYRTTIICSR